ncbi:MAG: MFS transporter [Bryobacterales bacterium]|nr:MFS transporter [Bryobacterales bacterium]
MPPTRARYSVLALVFFAAVITYLDRVCISVAAPAMQRELGLTQFQFSWVFTAFYLAYTIFEMPAAWLSDRWGQRTTMIRIVGCWSVFTILTGVARTYPTLLITRFVFGAGEAGAFPTLSRAISRWFPVDARSRANGLMWAGARFGGAVSPALAVAVMAWMGWRGAFALFGAVGLIWVAIWAWWYRDDPAAHPAVNPAELAEIEQGVAPPPKRGEPVPWRRLLLDRDLLMLCSTYFASGFGFQFFVTWLPTYLTKEYGQSLTRSGLYSSLPLLAGATGCLAGGMLADYITRRTGSLMWGRRSVGAGGFLLGAAGFVAAINAGSAETAIASLVLASGAHDMILPVLWASCTDIGGRFGGTASGWVNLASSLSGMTAPLASAWLADAFGSFAPVFYVAAALYLLSGALWLIIDPRRREIS